MVGAATVVGCGGTPPSNDARPAATAASAAVQVMATGCRARPSLGAGSVIAPDRIVTVAHLVAGSELVTVIDAAGSEHTARVVGLDRNTDLALLAVDGLGVQPLDRATLPPGDEGSFVVYRDGPIQMTFTTRAYVDIRTNTIDGDGRVTRRGYEVVAPIRSGDSGAVLVVDGTAIGVLYARSTEEPTRSWAVDIAELQPLLTADTGAAVDVGACVGVA
jgi:S1-C subfamily serine protease